MINKILVGVLGALVLNTSIATAQDEPLTNKNGQEILPKAGDFAIGFNALPVFYFVGNTFNGNLSNTFIGNNKFVSNLGNNVLFGKYMLTEKSAIRMHLRIANNKFTNKNFVYDDTKNSPDSMVTDQVSIVNQQYILGGGYEMRRGRGRLRGIFGGEAFIGVGNNNQRKYSYGNNFGILNPAPTATTWNNGGGIATSGPIADREISRTGATSFTFGIRPFVGVEYFFAPCISLGAEFGWSLSFTNVGDATSTFEYYEASTGNTVNRQAHVAGNNTFNIDTDNFNGALFLMFYF
jgi:hypothetical protein